MPITFVLVVTLSVLFGVSAMCRCPFKTAAEKFCAAKSASLVYVKDRGTVIDSVRRYRVELLHQYKTFSLLGPAIDSKHVYTPAGKDNCGVSLREGAIYVISGRYALSASMLFRFLNSRMTTSLCDLQLSFDPAQPFVPPKC